MLACVVGLLVHIPVKIEDRLSTIFDFATASTMQLTSLRDAYPALQKADVEVWAISTDGADGPRGQKAFSQHLQLPFPPLPDVERKISLAYGGVHTREQMAARMSVLVDKQGVVRWIDKQINPKTHGQDVLKSLNQK